MAINADGGRIARQSLTPADFQQAREARQARLDARVQDATLNPTSRLGEQQIKEHQGYYNNSLDKIDGLLGGPLKCLPPPDWNRLFPGGSDARIDRATRPNIFDNPQARDVKQEYAAAKAEAARERTQAARTADKLGPGEHTLSNGDKVTVTVDPKTGKKTVATTTKNGETKTVTFDPKDSDSVSVVRKDRFGNEEKLERDGTKITKEKTGHAWGFKDGKFTGHDSTTKTTYDVDIAGRASRTTEGPQKDDYERTTVNNDGSTDTRKLIYNDENGKPVYEDKHMDPNRLIHPLWPPEHPDPWRPFPLPRFPWDLDPFRPIPDLILFKGEAEAN